MKFDTIVTFVDMFSVTDNKTGELRPYGRVTLQTPVQKTEKNPYAFGTIGVNYTVDSKYYEKFKSIYAKGTKINVVLDVKPTIDPISKKHYLKYYIKAVDGVEL